MYFNFGRNSLTDISLKMFADLLLKSTFFYSIDMSNLAKIRDSTFEALFKAF